MAISKGIFRTVALKKETTFGTKAGATGAQEMRRTTFDLNLIKDTYQSSQIATHQQIVDMRHGTRRVEGTLNDEISCTTHKDLWAALLRNAWVQGVVATPTPGHLFVPQSGHTNDSFTIESWRSDISVSETATGCRITQAQVSIPANGIATVGFTVLGQDMETATSRYFTTPTAATTTSVASGAIGEVKADGAAIAVVTGAEFTVNGNGTTGAVIGSDLSPDVFVGVVEVSGQLTLYMQDKTILDQFINEDTLSLSIQLDEGGTSAHFMRFSMPKIKLGSYTVADVAGEAVATCQFTALMDGDGLDAKAKSVILIEDSRIAA